MSSSITSTLTSAPAPLECAPKKPSRLWLWFVAAFLLQFAAWTTWFVIAAQNKVQEVPLAGAIGSKQ
jgi:hypothetical protein